MEKYEKILRDFADANGLHLASYGFHDSVRVELEYGKYHCLGIPIEPYFRYAFATGANVEKACEKFLNVFGGMKLIYMAEEYTLKEFSVAVPKVAE